jgi:hypothetical protein
MPIPARLVVWGLALASVLGISAAVATAQIVQGVSLGETVVVPVDMAIGRSIPMTTRQVIQRVSVANPEVADVIIIGERELVVNALASGLTADRQDAGATAGPLCRGQQGLLPRAGFLVPLARSAHPGGLRHVFHAARDRRGR